jgi:4-amino-4-deoxy-L-arabinose transferase-like glycosyltransferase
MTMTHGVASPVAASEGLLERLVAFARRRPGTVLMAVVAVHLAVWTILPILTCPNLQLDLAEDLALGKEWQLGYWKHPPLPWWTADLFYRFTGSVDATYLLGPLAAVICFYGVWLLAREVTDELTALIVVLALEGIHYYNFSVVKFAHDQVQLPFWAFTGLFFYRALRRGHLADWALAGAFLAGAFWSKYAAFALAAALGLFLLLDPVARRSWRSGGPYVMALAFAIVIVPNAWWLVRDGFQPFQYIDERALAAAHWYQYLYFPLHWSGGQLLTLLPTLALLALLYRPGESYPTLDPDATAAFDQRIVAMLAFGPFLVTTVVAAALGRLPIAMWGYPLWSFAPLALLLWSKPAVTPLRLRQFAAGALFLLIAYPVIYVVTELGEPFLRDRPKATQFPGQTMADAITRAWHERYGTPLIYVGGTELAVNNLAVYSPDRPHVLPHGDPNLAPWVDMRDLLRRGAVLVWEEGHSDARLEGWGAAFGALDIQPILVLARQTWSKNVAPANIVFAFVPPRP